MAKSLQQIGDYYLSKGLRGEDLRKALEKDSEFQKLLAKRKAEIRNKYGVTEQEEAEYLMPNEEDYVVLAKVKTLENKNLSDHDKELVEMIRSQLKADWRTPLLEKLEILLQKYS